MLSDRFHRIHDYLRISLTDACNLRCFYCMPDEITSCTPHSQLMQPAEIETLVRIFVGLGVRKIRLTGGEPLVRKEAAEIIQRVSQFPVELTLTTNGIRAAAFIPVLKTAGVRSLNVSLDTLDSERFFLMTKRPQFQEVMESIQALLVAGFRVKVNVVVMKGINDREIRDFVAWTKHTPIHVRFIEFMPFTGNKWQDEKVMIWPEILAEIAQSYDFVPLPAAPHDTAKKYQVNGHAGTFAIITTMSAPFCGDCNRMRLTADGRMKNCLFSKGETDLLSVLRSGGDIIPLIQGNLLEKEAGQGGQFTADFHDTDPDGLVNRSMIAIGG
jgi:cyclic pyranopterin phosphate synthase